MKVRIKIPVIGYVEETYDITEQDLGSITEDSIEESLYNCCSNIVQRNNVCTTWSKHLRKDECEPMELDYSPKELYAMLEQ